LIASLDATAEKKETKTGKAADLSRSWFRTGNAKNAAPDQE